MGDDRQLGASDELLIEDVTLKLPLNYLVGDPWDQNTSDLTYRP